MSITQLLNDSGPLERYGTGPIHFAGGDSGLYERHLLFDNMVPAEETDARDRFEAFARSGRDVLSQRWTQTQDTYTRKNAKRIYYLSMEFLIGRSLANNVTNLLLAPVVNEVVRQQNIDWIELLEQEPDAALGNGGLGRLAACFLESMATLQLPAMGYGLRYEYGIFKQTLEDGWQRERPDNWLRRQDPWEGARPHESVEVKLNCSFEVRGGTLRAISGRPSSLIGIPFDRPVVGYGGANINTLRLWAAGAPDYFDFQAFSHGNFVKAVAETLEAENITRVLYPDDSTSMGQALRFVQEYFLVACSLADLARRFRRSGAAWEAFPEKVAIQLNDTHPTLAIPELMRILLDDEHLGWDQAREITGKTFGYTGPALRNMPISEPHNLGRGWAGFNFEAAFGRPVKLINDAAMQALGSYRGGKTLFLSLGTGLRSALVTDGIVEPMELGHLPWKRHLRSAARAIMPTHFSAASGFGTTSKKQKGLKHGNTNRISRETTAHRAARVEEARRSLSKGAPGASAGSVRE